jgi:hypothetical protein
MRAVRFSLLAWSLILPGTALAAADPVQPTPPAPAEHRLSADQVEKILDDAARKRELAEMSTEGTGPAIHGEIGFSVGTGGYRSAFGTAVVPLPGDGVAILSLGTDTFGPVRLVDYRER